MFQSSSRDELVPPLLSSWRELVLDGETRLLLFTAMCVGTAEFALEGPVMMALGGVLGFDVAENAAFLSAYNVPRGIVSVLAEPILRKVPAQGLAAGGLLSAACGVAWLAALGERAHDTFLVKNGSYAFVSARGGSRALAPSYVSAAALGLGVVCVHVSLPVLLAQAAAKPRHGARYGAAFGLSAVMAKAGGGAVGMGLAAVAVERAGFTAAFGGIAAVLLAGAGAVAVAGGNLRVAFEK